MDRDVIVDCRAFREADYIVQISWAFIGLLKIMDSHEEREFRHQLTRRSSC